MMRVVVAGGGVAGLEAVLALRAHAGGLVEIDVVSPEKEFVYRPSSVAEAFGVGETRRFPLRRLVELAGARLEPGSVAAVNSPGRVVITTEGREIAWDALVLALGAHPVEAVRGALTFAGPRSVAALAALLEDARAGRIERIVFAVPAGVGWPLPIYELALLAQRHLADAGVAEMGLALVTPEPDPLAVFGTAAAQAVGELLASRGVEIHTQTTPVAFEDGKLSVVPDGSLDADRVVALPALRGPPIRGVATDERGFVPTDEFGRVAGGEPIFAAGDATTFPIKQGGIATQQADVAAESIAQIAGAAVRPEPFRPILRGLLLTGSTPSYLRADVLGGGSDVDSSALWWPPAKIVGRHLAPFLATNLGLSDRPPEGLEGALPVELELERFGGSWSAG